MEKKGQGSIEYLLIIGAAVIIAVIVISLMMTLSQQGTGAAEAADVEGIYGDLDAYKQESLSKITLTQGQTLAGGSLGTEILRKDGTPITDNSILEQAYAAGEIVIYKDGTEVSIVEKEESARTNFESAFEYGYGTTDYMLWTPTECTRVQGIIGDSTVNKYIKITSALNKPELEGTSYKIDYDMGCAYGYTHPTYGAGRYLRPQNFDITPTSGFSNTISGWTWNFYDYEIQYGSSGGTTQIGIDPSTGTITGITGNITVDYYSQK